MGMFTERDDISPILETFFSKVKSEREYQVGKWGDAFDRKNTANDWVAYIALYLGKAVTMPWNGDTFCTMMVKVATLCAAAYEWCHRGMPPRHYDHEALAIQDFQRRLGERAEQANNDPFAID